MTCETPGAPCGSGLTCGDDHLCFASAPCTHPDATTPPDACLASELDLDGDCIMDAMDDCIAPAADALGDVDNDGLDNGPDPCPWDRVTTDDTDGDSIPRPCDPSPNQSGDRKRCTMAFSSTDLTGQLWGKRGNNDLLWTTTTANKIRGDGASQQASIRALESFEGAFATTYDAVVTLRGGDSATFTLWVRASDQTHRAQDGQNPRPHSRADCLLVGHRRILPWPHHAPWRLVTHCSSAVLPDGQPSARSRTSCAAPRALLGRRMTRRHTGVLTKGRTRREESSARRQCRRRHALSRPGGEPPLEAAEPVVRVRARWRRMEARARYAADCP